MSLLFFFVLINFKNFLAKSILLLNKSIFSGIVFSISLITFLAIFSCSNSVTVEKNVLTSAA